VANHYRGLEATAQLHSDLILFPVLYFGEFLMFLDEDDRKALVLGSSCSDQDAKSAARTALLKAHVVEVCTAYDRAMTDRLNMPVIFLVDCEDKLGRKVAGTFPPDTKIHTETSNGLAVRAVAALSCESAAKVCVGCFPGTRHFFPELAVGNEVPVIVWASNGCSLYSIRHEGKEVIIDVYCDVAIRN
jgi:hypothetical protein